VLILSQFAGASRELPEALIVNPTTPTSARRRFSAL
jgi:trehalose-6-phosphate synthase